MKLASGFCIPEPFPVHTGIKGRQVRPLIRFAGDSQAADQNKTKMNGFVEISTLLIHSAPKQKSNQWTHLAVTLLYPNARGVAQVCKIRWPISLAFSLSQR